VVYELLVIFAALALGGFVKGVTGAGTPILAVPVLASFFGVPFAIAIMIVPTIVTNLWQIAQHWNERHGLGYLGWLFVMAAVGIAAGTWLLTALPANVLGLALAIVVALYVVLRLVRPDWHIPDKPARRLVPWVGFASGLLQGATGISAPVSITYLSSIRLTRGQFIFAVSTLFISFTAMQLPALTVAGILIWRRLLLSCLALLPVLVALRLGNALGTRLSPRTFDRVILGLLAVIAAKLVYDAALAG